mgnify:CR=1 FL=1
MSDAYASVDSTVVAAWRVQHDTDEETHVLVVDLAGVCYLALALDFDAQGDLLTAEEVATTVTEDEATRRAEEWRADNPKGINAGGPITGLFG